MKRTRKLLVIMMSISLMAAGAMTGCSSSSSAAAETAATAEATSATTGSVIQGDDASSFYGTTLMGSVTAVDGNTVTVSAMAGGDQGGQQPSGDGQAPSSDGQAPSGDGQAPSGDGQQPSGDGQAPSGDGQAPSGDASGSSDNSQTPPEKPSGDAQASSGDGSTSESQTSSDGSTSESQASSDDSSSSESQAQAPSGGQAPSGDGQAPSGDASGSGDSSQTPPEMPSGDASGSSDSSQTPPEMPSGDASGSSDSSQTPPEMPSGDASGSSDSSDSSDASGSSDAAGQPSGGQMPDMQTSEIQLVINDESLLKDSEGNAVELSSLAEGDFLTVTVDESGNITAIVVGGGMSQAGGSMNGGGQPGGQSSGVDSYTSVNNYTSDTTVSDETIDSTGTDESAVLVSDGANATLTNVTVNRTSSDSTGGDNSSFYGVGAAVLTTDGTTMIDGGTITTDAKGGAGVFSYGDGVTYVNGTTISTTQDTSGGIHAAGGGTLYCWDADVTTQGESSAAIRSDRGGGTMVVDGGTYTANGTGSPAVYCTADITVNDADLTATGSEAVCIEGLNTLRLFDCNLTGNMPDNEQNDCTWNIILYQSMSGDSEVGNSTLDVEGGTITAQNGGLLYTTNTESNIRLCNVDITYADENDFFLKCTGNSNARGWGNAGSNGAQCTFTGDSQEMEGDVIWDSISELDFYMINGSTLTGAVIDDESNAGNGGSGYANMTIDAASTWVVTGDSTLTALNCEGKIVDADGNTVSVVGTDGTTYVEGTSQYTVTVSSYSDSADTTGAAQADSFSNYEVENPMA